MKKVQLDKAPIQEAIFDVTFTNDRNLAFEEYEKFGKEIINDFPHGQHIVQAQVKISGSQDLDPDVKQNKFGINYSDESRNKMIQIRANGFTFFQLNKTYVDWLAFKSEAVKWLNKYIAFSNVKLANRIALRFINQIQIPLPLVNLSDYLNVLPSLGNEIESKLSNIFMRLELPSEKYKATGIINEIIQPPIQNKTMFILDIDVVKQRNVGEEYNLSEDAFLKEFDLLRDFKNDLFFGSLKEETKKLFI